ncbi:hypothetical protein MJD09_26310 [bacterium]|nr:hypothetical protein [bacterium]
MWHILRAEISYNKAVLIGMILANFGLILLPELYVGELDVDAMWIPYLIGAYAFFANMKKEKRDRLFATLPSNRRSAGATRVALPLLLHLPLAVFFFFINIAVFPEQPDFLWLRFSILGCLPLPWMLITYVYRDLRMSKRTKSFWMLMAIMVLISGLMLAITVERFATGGLPQSFLHQMISSAWVAVVIYALTFWLFYYGVHAYQRRKSFLH